MCGAPALQRDWLAQIALSDPGNESAVPFQLVWRGGMRAGQAHRTRGGRCGGDVHRGFHHGHALCLTQTEPDLPPAGQLDIDLRQQFGIEQRPMLDPVRAIDPVAGAQRIERVFSRRDASCAQARRYRTIRSKDRWACGRCVSSSLLRKPKSKPALCATSGASPRNSSKSSALSAKRGFVARNAAERPCTRFRFHRHIAFGVEIRRGRYGPSRPGRPFRCSRFPPCDPRSWGPGRVVSVSKMISRIGRTICPSLAAGKWRVPSK